MRHRLTLTCVLEFEVDESNYPDSRTDAQRLGVDVEWLETYPAEAVDDDTAVVTVKGELIP